MGEHEDKKPAAVLYKKVNSSTTNTHKKRQTLEKQVFDGPKGMTAKLFQKEDDKVLKVSIKELDKDKFGIRISKNKKTEEKELNMKDLVKFLKGNKDLDFVLKYVENDMEKFRKNIKDKEMSGGGKRRKSSKKTSKKKVSKRKGSKKVSKRKGSKKVSKRKASKRK